MWKETDSDLNSCQRIQVSFFFVFDIYHVCIV